MVRDTPPTKKPLSRHWNAHSQDDKKHTSSYVDRFAFSLKDIEPFTGEPLQIHPNSIHPIFRPPHKLEQVEWDFVHAQRKKLEALGFIQRSPQKIYVSATVVVRKKDAECNYKDFRSDVPEIYTHTPSHVPHSKWWMTEGVEVLK